MVYADCEPLSVIACGGAGLLMLGVISRSTSDVDLIGIARVDKKGKISVSKKSTLPKEIVRLVSEVAVDERLDHDWLNFGPSSLLKVGLPPGALSRLIRKNFGNSLTVYFVSRRDQVALKIFAVMRSRQAEKHLSDLMDLKPKIKEVCAAVEWLLKRKTSRSFKDRLKEVLSCLGYENTIKNH